MIYNTIMWNHIGINTGENGENYNIDIIHTYTVIKYSKGAFDFLVLLAYWKSAPSFTLIQTCKLSPDLNFSFPKCLLVLIQNQFNSRQFFLPITSMYLLLL